MRTQIFLAISFLIPACSSLEKSSFEQSMKQQGTFTCAQIPDAAQKETNAEADVSRVRCYQDQWLVEKNEAVLTRILYQTPHCEKPLGRVIDHYSLTTNTHACKLIKMNPGWVAEEKGKCLFNDLKPGTSSSVGILNQCRSHVPPTCFSPNTPTTFEAKPTSDEKNPNTELIVSDSFGAPSHCKRYAE